MATLAPSILIRSSSYLEISDWLNFSQIRLLTVALSALECLNNHFFCVVAILAPSMSIRSSSYLVVTRTTITSRMSSNFSQIQPLTAELSALDCEKSIFSVVATIAPSFLFGSSLFLEVPRTSLTSRMNSSFDQIRPLTTELSALECLKNQYLVLWPL